ncbi:NmrA family NAD(P)-binding protein [Rhodococcus hoagii]|nr:NmrA family NAD(P)-binding protein [Prescottella equi]
MDRFQPRGGELAVIGAAGKTGAAVVRALAGRPVRRVVHTARRAGDRRVDLETGEGLESALTGCRGVYFIAPNVHPDEPGLLRRTLDAAARAGVHHVVYHSVAWPHTPAMPHHLDKAVCEDMLRTHGGVQWTILQPCAYAENFPTLLDGTATALEVPYNPEAPFTFVRLPDVAAAAARVLDEGADVHHGVTYELGAAEVSSIGQWSRALPHEVTVRRIRVDEWADRYGGDLPRDARDRLIAMFDFYDRHGFVARSTGWEALLDRPPGRPAPGRAPAGR